MSTGVAESTVEEAALSWFEELGYAVIHGPEIAPGELFSERESGHSSYFQGIRVIGNVSITIRAWG